MTDPHLRHAIREAIRNGVNPALLPGLDDTTDRVLDAIDAELARRARRRLEDTALRAGWHPDYANPNR